MNDRHPEQVPDRRAAQRHQIELPVELEGGTGITSSVSTTGVVFRTDRWFAVGAPIRFCLEFRPTGEVLSSRVCCEGEVIRIDPCGNQWSVTVFIKSFQFQPSRSY